MRALKDGARLIKFSYVAPRVTTIEGSASSARNRGMGRGGVVMTARGCNMSFRRDLLTRIGGFDPHIEIFRDDTDGCFRVINAGYRVRFVPEAALVHLNAPSGGTRSEEAGARSCISREWRLYRQYYRHYRDNLYFLLKQRGH